MLELLDTARRRQLAAHAHHLNPVVMIGKEGLAKNVIGELDRSLTKHELIKIKLLEADRDQRASLLEQICLLLSATPIKQIGKVLIIYRINPDKKDIESASAKKTKPHNKLKHKPKSAPGVKNSGKKIGYRR